MSVIVPVHQAAGTVADVVARLAALEPPPGGLEVLVVDDGSTDGTAAAASEAARPHPTIRVLTREDRGGPTVARRLGLAAAQGRYVWHADVDDDWEPAVVVRLHEAARRHGAGVAVCRARRIEANGRSWTMEGASSPRELDAAEAVVAVLDGTVRGYLWNKLVRRELLEDHHDRPALATHDDTVVVAEALARSERTVLVPAVLYHYRERPGSVSTAPRPEVFADLRCAAALVERALRPVAPDVPAWRWDAFAAWFVHLPALTTPAHQGWDRQIARMVRRDHGRLLTWGSIVALARLRGPRLAVHAAAAKGLGPVFPTAYRLLGRVLGWSLSRAR